MALRVLLASGVFVCGIFAAILNGSARAEDVCDTPEVVLERTSEEHPGVEAVLLPPEATVRFLAAFHDLGGPVPVVADGIMIMAHERYPNAVIFIFQNGCAALQGRLPKTALSRVLAHMDVMEPST